MRLFFYIAYKGTRYHGWQIQPNALTIQEKIQQALNTLFKGTFEIVGSGRTDTGVHATEQVFQTDIITELSIESISAKLNGILPNDIAVHKIVPVTPEAHAGFDALDRSYIYQIHWEKSPFHPNESLFVPKKPDFELMNEAAKLLIGQHDFQSFSKVKTEVNNFICTIHRAEWHFEEHKAVFEITANRFLRGMVRALVGTLLDIGAGKVHFEHINEIIEGKNRSLAGRSVSPDGLYLCKINYPESIFTTA
jgi:tRNA pseudouridine38-40 synthase